MSLLSGYLTGRGEVPKRALMAISGTVDNGQRAGKSEELLPWAQLALRDYSWKTWAFQHRVVQRALSRNQEGKQETQRTRRKKASGGRESPDRYGWSGRSVAFRIMGGGGRLVRRCKMPDRFPSSITLPIKWLTEKISHRGPLRATCNNFPPDTPPRGKCVQEAKLENVSRPVLSTHVTKRFENRHSLCSA